MPEIPRSERATQNCVITLFRDEHCCPYSGDRADRKLRKQLLQLRLQSLG